MTTSIYVCQVSSWGSTHECLRVGSAAKTSTVMTAIVATVGELKISQSISPVIAPAWHNPSNNESLAYPYFMPATATKSVPVVSPSNSKAVRGSWAAKAAAIAIPVKRLHVNHEIMFGRVLPLIVSIM